MKRNKSLLHGANIILVTFVLPCGDKITKIVSRRKGESMGDAIDNFRQTFKYGQAAVINDVNILG